MCRPTRLGALENYVSPTLLGALEKYVSPTLLGALEPTIRGALEHFDMILWYMSPHLNAHADVSSRG